MPGLKLIHVSKGRRYPWKQIVWKHYSCQSLLLKLFEDIKSALTKATNCDWCQFLWIYTLYPKKYAHGFVVLCFVVVMQSFIMNSHEVFIHIHQDCFAGTGAIVRLPQCQWNKPDGYGKISQCITTTKHSKAKTVCIFLGIYCTWPLTCKHVLYKGCRAVKCSCKDLQVSWFQIEKHNLQ